MDLTHGEQSDQLALFCTGWSELAGLCRLERQDFREIQQLVKKDCGLLPYHS
ncbi:hypothetical protein [Limnothrix redekei]|uniref:hypothetical protein n=1 Tax=Limnothrix redekei TaxID=132606 RepID=UPI00371A7AA8